MEAFRRLASERGVEFWGVCPWGTLSRLLDCRGRARLPVIPASVIVLLFPYYCGDPTPRNLARYTLAADYHRVAGGILTELALGLAAAHPGRTFVPFVDSSPIPEVEAAARAGLGVLGQNGQLINEKYGSYVFIGEIVTDLPLPATGTGEISRCECCGACAAACPTGALTGSGFLLERCRSHFSQRKGELAPWEIESLRAGGLVWGCDCCGDVCPHNAAPRLTPILGLRQGLIPLATGENLPGLAATRACGWRGTAPLRRNLEILAGGGRAAPT